MIRPSIDQIQISPELSTLAVLDAAADMAVFALAAVYPELQDLPDPSDNTPAHAALSVIEHVRALGFALTRYRRDLRREHQRDDLLLF